MDYKLWRSGKLELSCNCSNVTNLIWFDVNRIPAHFNSFFIFTVSFWLVVVFVMYCYFWNYLMNTGLRGNQKKEAEENKQTNKLIKKLAEWISDFDNIKCISDKKQIRHSIRVIR